MIIFQFIVINIHYRMRSLKIQRNNTRKKAISNSFIPPSYSFLSFFLRRASSTSFTWTYVRTIVHRRNIIPDRDRRERERSTRFIWRSFALSLTHEPSREPAGFYPLLHALLYTLDTIIVLEIYEPDKLLYYSSCVVGKKEGEEEREKVRRFNFYIIGSRV